MRYRALLTAAGTAAAATLALGGIPAGGQEEPDPDVHPAPLVIDPAFGLPGTEVTISGEGCMEARATVTLEHATGVSFTKRAVAWAADEGAWSITHTFDADDPPGTYAVSATCDAVVTLDPPVARVVFEYPDTTFVLDTDEAPLPEVISVAIDPTSGPIGTAITVSGDDCTGDLVWFGLFPNGRDGAIDLWWANPAADGSWTGDLTVYDTMVPLTQLDAPDPQLVPIELDEDLFVGAWCEWYPGDIVGEVDEPITGTGPTPDYIAYSHPVDFDLTGGGDAPRTDPLPDVSVVPTFDPQAQPATPVAGDPTYTG